MRVRKYEANAMTMCPHYPDGSIADVSVYTVHGPNFFWTYRGARRWIQDIRSEGCTAFRWAITNRRQVVASDTKEKQ